MKNTLCIVGAHPKTLSKFDSQRTDCDVWVFNEAVSGRLQWAQCATAVFQMHERAIWSNPKNRNDPGHYAWLKSQTAIPVYMQDKFEEVPGSERYPLEEIIERFKIRYFTSSVSYALALAAYLGTYTRVEIYGVEMETNTEYQYQRDGVTLWIGVLLGLGVDVYAPLGIFDQPLYGYEGEVSIPYETFEKRIDELAPHIEISNNQYAQAAQKTLGAVEAFLTEDSTSQITEALQAQFNLSQKLGLLVGAKSENLRYKKKADAMNAEAGKFLFSRQEFESSAKKLADQAAEKQVDVNAIRGKGEMIHEQIKNAAKGSPKRKKLLEQYKDLMREYLQGHNTCMIYTGGAKENYAYMERLDKGIRAAGGAKSEAVLLEVDA
jgi:hypothetical protein